MQGSEKISNVGAVMLVIVAIVSIILDLWWIAAVIFVLLTALLSLRIARSKGFVRGILEFLRHLFFDW